MSKYQAYPEYTKTELGWLTEIPKHWEIKKLKYLGEALIGLTYSPNDVVDENEGTLVLRSSNVQNKLLSFNDNVFVKKQIPEHLKVKVGDILICARNGSRALIGKNAVITKDAEGMSFGAFMSVFRSPYNNYLSKVFNSALFEYQSGSFLTATINQLTTSNLNSFEIPLPPKSERDLITTFLDHETTKIDTLIEKQQQQLIELLKEKRQAVISHAVTKGLNPDAPMKDSGVEWLKQIPEHWKSGRLTYQLDLLVDGTHHSPESYHEGDYRYVTAKNIKEHGFDFSNISYVPALVHQEIYSRCSVKEDDVLYIKDGATAGIAMVNNLNEQFSLLSSVAVLRPHKTKILSKFLAFHLNASIFKNEMLNRLSGGAMTRFTIDGISRFNIVIPPIEEQNNIIKYLEIETSKIDILIGKAQQAIQLMQERRTALISAAVTGKIDVRHFTLEDGIAPTTSGDTNEAQQEATV